MKRLKIALKRYPAIRSRLLWAKRIVSPLASPSAIFRYISLYRDMRNFRKKGGQGRIRDLYPCLFDKRSTTPYDPYYFFQGVWIVGKLKGGSAAHVDIGSDVKVVGILTNFCPVTFVDIRPLDVALENLSCREGSILEIPFADHSLSSLSCMHVIEHIGLGRYGDPIDPGGSEKACEELKRVLAPGGDLYITVPIGANRVCFNAHRVFSPQVVLDYFSGLNLVDFAAVDDAGNFHPDASPDDWRHLDTGLGLFHFRRTGIT